LTVIAASFVASFFLTFVYATNHLLTRLEGFETESSRITTAPDKESSDDHPYFSFLEHLRKTAKGVY
jgi:hypothetical protein